MTMLMTSGEFDLSVGSVFGFSAVVMWTLYNEGITTFAFAFLIAIAIAVLIGFANGWFVTILKIPSFLVTLGMMLVVRGSALYITDGFPQGIWKSGHSAGAGSWPARFISVVSVSYATVFWFILVRGDSGLCAHATKVGNWIQASGGNAVRPWERGVRVGRTKTMLFVLTVGPGGVCGHRQLDPCPDG